MPLYVYSCSCGWEVEEYFRRRHDAEDTDVPLALVCAECSGRVPRKGVTRFGHESLIHDGLERYESALLSPAERAAGARFRSVRELERYEESKGYTRIEKGTQAWRDAWDSQRDDARAITSRAEAEAKAGGDGDAAGCDYVDRSEIQSVTGWGDLRYETWKESTDAAEHAAHDDSRATG